MINSKYFIYINYISRCGGVFCSVHRYSEAHICSYDYKAEGKKLIQLTSSLINDARFPKI